MPELTPPFLRGAILVCSLVVGLGGCTSTTDGVERRPDTSAGASVFASAPDPAVTVWRKFGNAHQFEIGLYGSLSEMARHAEAIVYGEATAIAVRQQPGAVRWARAFQVRLRILDVIKGDRLEDGDSVWVVIGAVLGPHPYFRQRYGGVLGDHGLFFVDRAGAPQPEFGIPADPAYLALGIYDTVTPQGVLLNDRGVVKWGLNFGGRGFPRGLSGTPFSQLIEQVKAAVRGTT